MDIREAVSIFGLEAFTDDFEVLEKRYKQLIQRYHPDKGGNHEDMLRIQEALDTLKSQLGQVEAAWKISKENARKDEVQQECKTSESYKTSTYDNPIDDTPYETYTHQKERYNRNTYETAFTRAERPHVLRGIIVMVIVVTLLVVCSHIIVHNPTILGFSVIGLCVVVTLRVLTHLQNRRIWKFLGWVFILIFTLKLGWWI